MRAAILATLLAVTATTLGSRPGLAREVLAGPESVQQRAYSPGIVTEGGRIVWLAGQTSNTALDGTAIGGNFEAQVRDIFARINATLGRAGGQLSDIATMTVFITDTRYGNRFVELRREIFGRDFPASALITVVGLAQPGLLVEVQAVAVVGSR